MEHKTFSFLDLQYYSVGLLMGPSQSDNQQYIKLQAERSHQNETRSSEQRIILGVH